MEIATPRCWELRHSLAVRKHQAHIPSSRLYIGSITRWRVLNSMSSCPPMLFTAASASSTLLKLKPPTLVTTIAAEFSVSLWGFPASLFSDNGLTFQGFPHYARVPKHHQGRFQLYHPSTNGGIEGVHQAMTQLPVGVTNGRRIQTMYDTAWYSIEGAC